MTDQTQFLLNQAIVAIKAGDLAGGRKLLESVLEVDPDNENAWVWMSAAVSTDVERRHCLEQVLKLNPDNAQAKHGLEKLAPASAEAPAPESEEGNFENLMADFAAFDETKEGPAGTSVPAFTWPLEPEQRDLAPETGSEDVDLEALFKSFDAAAETGGKEEKAFEWTFDEPAGASGLGEGEKPGGAGEQLSGEESLDRFLGVESPKSDLRGFYEEDARQGKAVPAFTFDEEIEAADQPGTAGVDTSSEAFVSPPLADTEFSFDIDRITSESEAGETPEVPATSRVIQLSEVLKLWANPGGKANSVIILRDQYMILANPDPLFIERIREEVDRGEVKKKSLGRTAKAIELKSLLRVEGEPEASNFEATYLKGKQKITVNAEFESTEARNEAMEAILGQLGLGYQKVEENVKRSKLILLPLIAILIACLGTPLLIYLSTLMFGMPDLAVPSLALILPVVIGLAGFLVFAGGLISLISRMRQPLHLVAIVPAGELSL